MKKLQNRHRQLELPVLSNVKGQAQQIDRKDNAVPTRAASSAKPVKAGASAEDQSIYRAMSDSYFCRSK